MVRNSLQKAVFADFLLARNRFRTNYKATFLWDSSASKRINYETAPLKTSFSFIIYYFDELYIILVGFSEDTPHRVPFSAHREREN